jgi:hypothetical protein
MSSTEDRARTAMRAIAGTVNDAPPLRLTPVADSARAPEVLPSGGHGSGSRRLGQRHLSPRRPGEARRRGRRGGYRPRWSLLAPVAAAVTVVAVALALLAVRDIPNGRAAAPSATPVTGPVTGSLSVPEYYVAWMRADTPYLVVGNTFTGTTITTVKEPAGVYLQGVYGAAADDRTFIATGARLPGHGSGTAWYLLRIAPGSGTPARLTPLPIPVRQSPAGVALSPDGAEVAVALPGSPATLRVYSVATGALLRQWSTTAHGELTAEKVPAGGWQFTAMVLRWSADGRQLAFGWNATAIRLLDATAPDGDLITSSKAVAGIGIGYGLGSSTVCNAAQGWQPVTVTKGAEAGQGIVCAGGEETYTSPARNSVGFLLSTKNSQGDGFLGLDSGSACPGLSPPDNGAYLGWASADGSVVIGSEVCGGHARFGVFAGSQFTPLPAPPDSLPVPAGVMDGTVAW